MAQQPSSINVNIFGNKDDELPPSFKPIEDDSSDELPSSFKPIESDTSSPIQQATEQPKDDSFMSSISSHIPDPVKKTWDFANKSLFEYGPDITNPAKQAARGANALDVPTEEEPWRIPFTGGATWKGLGAGMLEGAGNVVNSLATPLNLATMGAMKGSSSLADTMPTAARGLGLIGRGLSAPVALHGAGSVIDPSSSASQRGFGLAELAGGIAGMSSPSGHANEPINLEKPPISEPVLKPELEAPNTGSINDLVTSHAEELNPELKAAMQRIDDEIPPDMLSSFKPVLDPEAQSIRDQTRIRPKGWHQQEDLSPTESLAQQLQRATEKAQNSPGNRGIANESSRRQTATQSNQPGSKPPVKPPKGNLFQEQLDPEIPIEARDRTPQKSSLAAEIYNLPRGLMSIDLPFLTSAAFRQASPLAWTGDWLKAWSQAAKTYGSKAAHDAIQENITSSKYFKPRYEPVVDKTGNISKYVEKPSFAEEVGLKMSDLKTLTSREEHIASGLAEKIPVYGIAVRASNRAYTSFLNDLRKNTFEKLIQAAKETGDTNPETNLVAAREIAEFVNNATGRGSLKAGIPGSHTINRAFGTSLHDEINLEQSTKLLTATLFSPRLMASRLKFLNPATYEQASPAMRIEYMKGLSRSLGTWVAFAGLAQLAGATVSKDPNSSDFGKIKIGNTRIDSGAGFQQYMVLGSRMATGKFSSSSSGKTSQMGVGYKPRTRLTTAEEFMANKLHPMVRLAYDLMNASSEKPVDLGDETVQRVLPMMVTDIVQASKDDPALAALVGTLSSVGMGTQTYEPGRFNTPTYIDRKNDFVVGR
jgi:hypothetical protein